MQPTMQPTTVADGIEPVALARVESAVRRFVRWLDEHGETSCDHQSFFAGRLGGAAKRLYYHRRRLGTLAVAPMIMCEAPPGMFMAEA